MRKGYSAVLGALSVAAILAQGCGGGAHLKRPVNVEVRLVSQSCFQGEVVPCG